MLVTGATGFVGQALCRCLLAEKRPIRVLLRNPKKIASLPEKLQTEVVCGDLLDKESLLQACAAVDLIVHLAGTAHTVASSQASIIQGSKNLLAAATAQKVRRLVYLSSSLAHAAETGSGDVTEYGKSKRAVESLLLAAAHKNHIEVAILRPVNVYGSAMKGNIATMMSLISKGRLPGLPALHNRISLVGVEDLARAILLAANAGPAPGIYSVTDGEEYRINEIESAIYAALGKTLPRWRAPAVLLYVAAVLAGLMGRLGGLNSSISARTYRNLTADNLFSNDEICTELGFKPSQNFYSILPEMLEQIKRADSDQGMRNAECGMRNKE